MHRTLRARRSLGLSLLAAAGFAPFACSGDTTTGPDRGHAGDKGTVAGANGAGEAGASAGLAGESSVAGAAGAGEAGGAGGAAPIEPGDWKFPCTSPELDPVSGLVTCKEGYQHRPSAAVCAATGGRPRGDGGAGGHAALPRIDDASVNCSDDDSLCEKYDLGFCHPSGGGGGYPYCLSGCETDSDCGTGRLCLCDFESPHGGVCVQAGCATTADCAEGYRCVRNREACGNDFFECQRAADTCVGDAQCGVDETCSSDDLDQRACADLGCAIGRPFLVDAAWRVAPVASRRDWLDTECAPLVSHLSELERARVAAHWSKLGQLEHASIAALARFSLQLLSFGAPAELVEACTQALADETAHARLCFAIASSYAGRKLGPGPLDIEGSLLPSSLAEVVDLVILEGCLGESGAVLEALDAAEIEADPVLAGVYRRIAADEQRHAELAFRFLRWAFEQDREAVSERLLAVQQTEIWLSHPARALVEPCFDALIATARLAA